MTTQKEKNFYDKEFYRLLDYFDWENFLKSSLQKKWLKKLCYFFYAIKNG